MFVFFKIGVAIKIFYHTNFMDETENGFGPPPVL